ncbi:hypothetical protein RchiOBHm_Chr7g0198181 [Rosa chinensis]|uniref:Uncharacterized protein n=1 Tax=Rosa chinensis TaxID=74649 RepID=A0A2P6P721_ROSCH|nr:hypothetical protein RchiOBHm_Chr7g0198181 [Rosa chinensis]
MNSLSFVDSKHSGRYISLLKKTGTARMRSIPERHLWSLNGGRICFDFGRALVSSLLLCFFLSPVCLSVSLSSCYCSL